MNPSTPYALSGVVTAIGAWREAGGLPPRTLPRIVVGTLVLVLITGLVPPTAKIAPVVRGIGFLALLSAVIFATKAFNSPRKVN